MSALIPSAFQLALVGGVALGASLGLTDLRPWLSLSLIALYGAVSGLIVGLLQ